MNEIDLPFGENARIEINGEPLPLIESVTEKVSEKLRYIEAFGEGRPRGTASGERRYELILRRIRGEALPAVFDLSLADDSGSVTYTGCRVISSELTVKAGEPVRELICISAGERT